MEMFASCRAFVLWFVHSFVIAKVAVKAETNIECHFYASNENGNVFFLFAINQFNQFNHIGKVPGRYVMFLVFHL